MIQLLGKENYWIKTIMHKKLTYVDKCHHEKFKKIIK